MLNEPIPSHSNLSKPCDRLMPEAPSSTPFQPCLVVIDQQRFVHELIALRFSARMLYRLDALRELDGFDTLSHSNAQVVIDPENTDLREFPGSHRLVSDGKVRRMFQPFANQILLFTSNADRKLTQRFLSLGASGLLLKAATSHELDESLRRLWLRRPLRLPKRASVRRRTLTSIRSKHLENPTTPFMHSRRHLSRRQCEVLAMLERGLPNKSISAELGLSLSTVKTHVSAILKALGANNRAQAAFKGSSLQLR